MGHTSPTHGRNCASSLEISLSAEDAACLLRVAQAVHRARRRETFELRLADVVRFISDHPGSTGREVRAHVPGSNQLIGEAITEAAARSLLRSRPGHGRAQHWFVVRDVSDDGLAPRPLIIGGTGEA
jgi:hypothetical protein